ncbi:MAG TPA: methyltransferase dimerization domain-containing protein, partial [Candidatus Sulfotelmatobacter sp.]|nr:methyltransferase dimerization domain-containing protein [Candidatus Sulfotelmatobacter sp.]
MDRRDDEKAGSRAAGSADRLAVHRELLTMLDGFMVSRAISVAAKLGVADHIEDRPVAVEELAIAVQADAKSLYRLLRFLASIGIFVEASPERFSHTNLSECLRSDA